MKYDSDNISKNIKQLGVAVDIFQEDLYGNILPGFFGEFKNNPVNVQLEDINHDSIKLVVGGCSFTYGDGVPSEFRWGDLLAEKMGVDHLNFSQRGWSTEHAVRSVMTYLKTNPKVKYVAILMPDLRRMLFPVNSYIHKYDVKLDPKKFGYLQFLPVHIPSPWFHEVPTYSKLPHSVREILTPEMSIYQSVNAIVMLKDYCDLRGINFVWSTWDRDTRAFYEESKRVLDIDLERFVALKDFNPNYEDIGLPDDCHLDVLSSCGQNFYTGSDDGKHSGVHQHIHWAEDFYQKLKDIEKSQK